MAGTMFKLGATGGGETAVSIPTTATVTGSPLPTGAARKLLGVIDVVAIGGTWSCTLEKPLGSGTITVADVGSITTTGSTVITLDTAFDGTTPNQAIPIPDQIVFTEDVAGDLTANVYLFVV